MNKRHNRLGKLSAEEAGQALRMFISEGKVTVREIAKALERRTRLIEEIRERLAALGAGAVSFVQGARKRRARRAPVARKRPAGRARRARRAGGQRLSPAVRAKYQLQGHYMVAIRALPKPLRAKVKAIRTKSGVHAAIRAAKAMASKKPVMRHAREAPK